MSATLNINENLLNFTDHLVSISEFSKGKTSKIFDDVKNNNTEYVVLKNNQPTAMVISMNVYKTLVEKASKMESLLERIEEVRLLNMAVTRANDTALGNDIDIDFEDFVKQHGFNMEDIISNSDSVEIE